MSFRRVRWPSFRNKGSSDVRKDTNSHTEEKKENVLSTDSLSVANLSYHSETSRPASSIVESFSESRYAETMSVNGAKSISCPSSRIDVNSSSGDELRLPQRKEKKPGLFSSLGRKIRGSFRRKDKKTAVISPQINTNKQARKAKKKRHPQHVKPCEKNVPSSSTSEDTSDAILAQANGEHSQKGSKAQHKLRNKVPSSLKTNISNGHHDYSSQPCPNGHSVHPSETTSDSERNGHVVYSDSDAIEEPSSHTAVKSTTSQKSCTTYTSIKVTGSGCNFPKCLCVDGNTSSSSNPYDSVGDVVLPERNVLHGMNSSDSDKPVPALPPRPDIVSITSPSPTRSHISTTVGTGVSANLTNLLSSVGLTSGSISTNNGVLELGLKAEQSTPVPWSLTKELIKLSTYGWYWGPLSRIEAEDKLCDQPDGSFLVRDSSDDRYLLSLSFRSNDRTLHTRIEHLNGVFSFYAYPELDGYSSIVELIEQSMSESVAGVFCYSRARTPNSPMFPVRLTKPVSRFAQARSLQYMCRFVIRQYTRLDHIDKLPLPNKIKQWLEGNQY